MEQHRARPPRPQQRSQSPLLPPGGPAEAAGARRVAVRPARTVPPVLLALRRLPSPRLTGLGSGLFAAAVMLVAGGLDRLLFDGSSLVYGLLFLPLSALVALWVRPADLVTAPIVVPIAFAVGLVPIAGGSSGFGGRVMAVVTALAVHAGWLYGGTLVAGLIATVRKVRLMTRRRTTARAAAQAAAQSAARVTAKAAAPKAATRRAARKPAK